MGLIKTKETLTSLLPVDGNVDEKLILRFLDSVEMNKIVSLIGFEFYNKLDQQQEELSDKEKQVLKFFQTASGFFAMIKAAKFLRTKMSNSGLNSTKTTNTEKATWYEFIDTVNAYYEGAYEALDNAFKFMESSLSDFGLWTNSTAYKDYQNLIVNKVSDFQNFYNINESWITFNSLKPLMHEVEEEYIKPFLGDCFDELKSNSEIKKLLVPAIVNYTVAKSAITGAFSFEGNLLKLQWSEFPHQKSVVMDETQRRNFIENREKAGLEYLRKLKKYLIKEKENYPCFKITESNNNSKIITNDAGMFLF
ncbi:DUF6712 family protein [Empedobacter brevis]|uniref:DUF6712 family protein n=1 Tax=Empedobacter brevis TaxID=247 RepID=UPI0028D8B384|nr:DUF6712 family protein [Empedobacter brevis]